MERMGMMGKLEETRNIFTKRLISVMKKKEISPKDLSAQTGIGIKSIYKYMEYGCLPKLSRLITLCEVLDVDMEWLCGLK